MAKWQYGIFKCFGDYQVDSCAICCCSFLVPCYQFGKNAEALGESCFLCGLASLLGVPLLIFGALQRQKLRQLKGIDGSMVGDVLMFLCCTECAIAQMGQELKSGVPGAQSMARE